MTRAVRREERYRRLSSTTAPNKGPSSQACRVATMGGFLGLEMLGDGETGASGLVPLGDLSLVVDQIGE